MNEPAQETARAIRSKIPHIEQAKLGPEYSYNSLPLCVIDAVFSIGVRYRNAQKAVEAWCASQSPPWPMFGRIPGHVYTISDMIKATEGKAGEALTERFFGGNRQRTSTHNGILKADAVLQFAKALQESQVEDFPDIRDGARAERASATVRGIPGQRRGISFEYLMMLAGDDSNVKADRMICRFVAEAIGKPSVPPECARTAVIDACSVLADEFPNLTPRLLDHLIWSYQRQRP